MLACARIGAIHSVIFTGFSAEALAHRIDDAQCKILLAQGYFESFNGCSIRKVIVRIRFQIKLDYVSENFDLLATRLKISNLRQPKFEKFPLTRRCSRLIFKLRSIESAIKISIVYPWHQIKFNSTLMHHEPNFAPENFVWANVY